MEFETAALLRKLLAQLALDDLDQREAAARSLMRLGPAALPAIEAARREAGSGLRWWLDAVTHSIEKARAADK